jgi:hypothetical protein
MGLFKTVRREHMNRGRLQQGATLTERVAEFGRLSGLAGGLIAGGTEPSETSYPCQTPQGPGMVVERSAIIPLGGIGILEKFSLTRGRTNGAGRVAMTECVMPGGERVVTDLSVHIGITKILSRGVEERPVIDNTLMLRPSGTDPSGFSAVPDVTGLNQVGKALHQLNGGGVFDAVFDRPK